MSIFSSRTAILLSATSILLLSACKKQSSIDGTPSHVCANITGVEGLYWDLANGVRRTDLGYVPTVKTQGGVYIHPTVPLLTFIYPAGYTPYTDPTSNAVGVNLIRNDNQSIWRYTNIEYFSAVTTQQVITSEVTNLQSFFGTSATATNVCAQQSSLPRAPGITTTSQSVLITFGNYTAVV